MYIIFYFFKHGLSLCYILRKLRKCGLEGMDRVFSVLLHEPSMHATKWARDTSSTPSSWRKFFTQNFHPKRTFMLWLIVAQLFCFTFFCLKHIAEPKWLAMFATAIKCILQGPAMSRKHQPMDLDHFISQIIQKASQPFTQLKQISITSLIETLGFNLFYWQETSHLEHPKVNTKGPNQIQKGPITFYPHSWNFRVKAYSTSQHSYNFEV